MVSALICRTAFLALQACYKGSMLVQHSADIHFILHNALYAEAMVKEGVTENLQDEMSDAIAAFMRTGNPNTEGGCPGRHLRRTAKRA